MQVRSGEGTVVMYKKRGNPHPQAQDKGDSSGAKNLKTQRWPVIAVTDGWLMAKSAMLVIGSLMPSRTGYMFGAESHSLGLVVGKVGNTSQGLRCSRRLSSRGKYRSGKGRICA